MRIGVIGYSSQNFNKKKARLLLREAFDILTAEYGNDNTVVSGLTDLGIPALAYREAQRRGWRTAEVACSKAFDYKLFPVNERRIVGENWGDESEDFLDSIDILVKVGGGKQSADEAKKAKSLGLKALEYNS